MSLIQTSINDGAKLNQFNTNDRDNETRIAVSVK